MLEKRGRTMLVVLIHNVGSRRKRRLGWDGGEGLILRHWYTFWFDMHESDMTKINIVEKSTRGHDCHYKTIFLTLALLLIACGPIIDPSTSYFID